MGVYTEYLNAQFSFDALASERKKQLRRISELREGRDVLTLAANLSPQDPNTPISMDYSDLLPLQDQLSNLKGSSLDLILETPGGSGEVAEDVVHLLRGKYSSIAVIVPGWAKSAGTIIAMACDEIVMDNASALGPIDAQIAHAGRVFSADAFLTGLKKIREDADAEGRLNLALVPMLSSISPGDIQHAENALAFARKLVEEWLAKYKFKNWNEHRTTSPGSPVTDADRKTRAGEIAATLCSHGEWLTHGRSIKIPDLERMRLEITDYARNEQLADAIGRYHALLRMTFESNVYKVFETTDSQIYRMAVRQVATMAPPAGSADPRVPPAAVSPHAAPTAHLTIDCGRCRSRSVVQANIGAPHPLTPGSLPFPADNIFRCPTCGSTTNISELRRQIEAQANRPVIT